MRISDRIAKQAEEMAAKIAEEQAIEKAKARLLVIFDRAIALISETYKKDRGEVLTWLQDDAHPCWEGGPMTTPAKPE